MEVVISLAVGVATSSHCEICALTPSTRSKKAK